ncbi:shufflon system plasmid conjugative transfer pilus tip adhesin PilV, partial [Pseudomonas aeruginosa]
VWTRPLNAARFDNNAGTVKYWCTLQGADIGMMYYDYIRYAITCGGRFCLGVNQVFGTRYQFGLITEIGPGFNYTTPYNTPDSTGVTITCSQ